MKHKLSDQKLLDKMSMEEKLELVSENAFKSRGNWLCSYHDEYYMTKSDYPYMGVREHMILWQKDPEHSHHLGDLINTFSILGYEIICNPVDKKSVDKFHVHVIKWE